MSRIVNGLKIPLNLLLLCLLLSFLSANLFAAGKWSIQPSYNIGYKGFDGGKSSINISDGSRISIERFQFDAVKLGLALAISHRINAKISLGIFSEMRFLIGSGMYLLDMSILASSVSDESIGLGMAIGPHMYLPFAKWGLGLSPYLALDILAVASGTITGNVFVIAGGVKADLLLMKIRRFMLGFHAGLELGAGMTYLSAKGKKVVLKAWMKSPSVGIYGGLSLVF
ncbi:MAG: hypothetical protein AAF975_03575 [Spirochaetota bacterium]